ncbi:M3 family oligoendopeptidase [Candidatus Woesearchaeota archaeon]|nr:M3 family oligoendopeptidase [Candidatus Woesearchaeota archaeon]
MPHALSAWNLANIQPKNINAALQEIEEKTVEIEKEKSLLTAQISPVKFLAFVKKLEELRTFSAKLSCYVELRCAENSSDQQAAADRSKVETALTKTGNRLLFFGFWFKDLPEQKAQELINASGAYKYHFQQLRKLKPYTLQENEEKIINIKDTTGVSALNSVYNTLTTQFTYLFQGKELTQEELLKFARSPKPQERKAMYQLLLSTYKKQKDVIGEIYKTIINDWREENVNLRKYKSPINVRNISHDLPDEAVEALLRVCEKNQSIFHTFFELKRKKLGLKKLTRFDLYAPLSSAKEKRLSYDEGMKLVLEAYGQFSPQFQKEAIAIIDAKHIHSQVQKNKQTGAFCCSVTAKLPPFCLWSYTGTMRDVSTVAHELGHGVHHQLARNNTEFTCHACLPLAETASIFGEMLLTENLLKKYPAEAQELLFFKLDDIYASIIRQAGFVRFEEKAHKMMEEGKTIEEMSAAYLADLRKQLGPKVEVDDLFAYEWAYIPHIFHTPFYCYAYAFGNLLTLALYEKYRKEGQKMVPKILEMLAAGGSKSPVEITKAVGVDITSEAFWQQGFEVIKEMVRKAE